MCHLLLEEINVKELIFVVGSSEKGEVCIVYSGIEKDFYYTVGHNRLENRPSDKIISEFNFLREHEE